MKGKVLKLWTFAIYMSVCLTTHIERRFELNRFIEALHEDPVNIGKILKHLKKFVKLEVDKCKQLKEPIQNYSKFKELNLTLDLKASFTVSMIPDSESKQNIVSMEARIKNALDLLRRLPKYEKKIRQHIVDYRKNLELSDTSNRIYVDGKLIVQSYDENIDHVESDIFINGTSNYFAYVGNNNPFNEKIQQHYELKHKFRNYHLQEHQELKGENLVQALTIVFSSIGLVIITVVIILLLQKKLAEINRIEPTITHGSKKRKQLFDFKKSKVVCITKCQIPIYYDNSGLNAE